MEIVKITESEFKKVKNQEGNVLIECYAKWSGPCKSMSPIINNAAINIKNCKFYRVDVEEADEVVIEYQIESVPTILLFRDGILVKKTARMMTEDEINRLINS